MALSAWIARFEGHEIRVVNTWFRGAKLYVDGVCVAEDRSIFALSARPVLEHKLTDAAGNERTIRVVVEAVITVKCAIFVDDVQYGGEVIDVSVDAARFPVKPSAMKALSSSSESVGVPVRLTTAPAKDDVER
jgi:hypothetical protein